MGKDKLRKFAENETFACLHQPDSKAVITADDAMKGAWNSEMFERRLGGKEAPIVVELGCGKGEYTIDLADRDPSKNYIGVDIKGARLWRGAKTATENANKNVAFLRTRIEFINHVFAQDEISEIWITFCDPQYKKINKRLTCPMMLDRYRKMLKKGGIVHLKTDCQELHEYTKQVIAEQGLELLACTNDLYGCGAFAGVDEEGKSKLDSYQTRYPGYEGLETGESGLEFRPCADPAPQVDGPMLANPALREVQTHYEQMFLGMGMPITYLAFKL